MTSGNIDSASLMNAVDAYASHQDNPKCRHMSYENWDDWTRKSIYSVTLLQIGDPLIMAPAPARRSQNPDSHSELYKCYDKVIESFNIDLRDATLQTPPRGNGVKFTKEDFGHLLNTVEPNDISRIVTETENEPSYEDWIKWAIKKAWVDHSIREDGLFNRVQIGVLSNVFGVSKKKMESLWVKTKNKSQVTLWSEGADHDDDFELAREAYVASAILRGLFHEKDAFEKGRFCHHHPIRRQVLSHPIRDQIAPLNKEGVAKLHFAEPMKYLVSLLVTAPWKEEKQINRVSLWTENTSKVKSACLLDQLDPRFFEFTEIDDAEARMLATDVAKNLKLRIYQKNYEKIFDYAKLLFMECTGYLSVPWLVPIVPMVKVVDTWVQYPLGRKILEKVYLRNRKLNELAIAQAGQIRLDFPNEEF